MIKRAKENLYITCVGLLRQVVFLTLEIDFDQKIRFDQIILKTHCYSIMAL